MIDQRVSKEKIPFFNKAAFTTTIPAQLVKDLIVKLFLCTLKDIKIIILKLVFKNLEFSNINNLDEITLQLNLWLEKMIVKNPTQWIWTIKDGNFKKF